MQSSSRTNRKKKRLIYTLIRLESDSNQSAGHSKQFLKNVVSIVFCVSIYTCIVIDVSSQQFNIDAIEVHAFHYQSERNATFYNVLINIWLRATKHFIFSKTKQYWTFGNFVFIDLCLRLKWNYHSTGTYLLIWRVNFRFCTLCFEIRNTQFDNIVWCHSQLTLRWIILFGVRNGKITCETHLWGGWLSNLPLSIDEKWSWYFEIYCGWELSDFFSNPLERRSFFSLS